MNSGVRSSAVTMMLPILRASGVPSSTCRLCLTRAARWPEVSRPSTHLASSRRARQCPTWLSVKTLGMCRSIAQLEPPGAGEQERAGVARDHVARVDRVEVALVGDVDHVEAQLEWLDRAVRRGQVAAH